MFIHWNLIYYIDLSYLRHKTQTKLYNTSKTTNLWTFKQAVVHMTQLLTTTHLKLPPLWLYCIVYIVELILKGRMSRIPDAKFSDHGAAVQLSSLAAINHMLSHRHNLRSMINVRLLMLLIVLIMLMMLLLLMVSSLKEVLFTHWEICVNVFVFVVGVWFTGCV